jgi:tetratricopeptide (TPR) repeat protein
MKENMEYIDNYFTGTMTSEEKKEFEQRLSSDRDFAEDVAFYMSAMQVAREESTEEKKNRFKELYHQSNHAIARPASGVRKLWPYMSAAAAVIIVFMGWMLFFKAPSPQQLADRYITKELRDLPVKMGTLEDSLAKGTDLYNEGKLSEALQIFENLTVTRPRSNEAKEFTGIVFLRLNQYDNALRYFKLLENQKGLHSNPGIFYEALTLLKRNLPGDEAEARKLLQQVVDQDLAKSEIAEEWLKKF